jgi:hypothetical protein
MKILVAGLSKTGTTALYSLISEALPENYYRLFEPKSYETNHSKNVLCKVLLGPRLDIPSFDTFDKRITIVRDIRDRLISILLYQQFHASYLKDVKSVQLVYSWLLKKEANPSSVSLTDILNVIGDVSNEPELPQRFFDRIKVAMSDFDTYITMQNNTLLYPYEHLVKKEFEPLKSYLDLELPDDILVPDIYKRVVRTKSGGNWRNWFTQTDIDFLYDWMSPWLTRYNYDGKDWVINERPFINPNHCSKYFIRLVKEATNQL